MRTRVFLATAVLLAMALSGCTEAEFVNPFDTAPTDETGGDGGNGTDDGTSSGDTENGTSPGTGPGQAPSQGTLVITAPQNVTVDEAFDVTINFYYPGKEPRPPVYNETGNGTGNETNRTVVDPGHPGTPAYHDDVQWDLTVTIGHLTWEFNGTSVPATVQVALNMTGNATLEADYRRGDRAVSSQPVQSVVLEGAAAPDVPKPVVFSGTVVVPLMDTSQTICDFAGTSYVFFGPEYWGWRFNAQANWVAEFWQGDANLMVTANSGIVPAGSDNVGSCPAQGTVTNGTRWTVTLTHPDYKP